MRAAKGDISSYSNAVDLFAVDHNDTYPKSLNDLVSGDRKYVRELRNDPWGNPYNYKPGTDTKKVDYQIYSSGRDGIPDNDDDVTSTSAMP
ncbi:MAG: type II secretion system protein GspG [Candidatus Hydrogenedentes bacterium]|nr:type II secretion system protein GspG [Candidatus Hydrogenedentota bacterium]